MKMRLFSFGAVIFQVTLSGCSGEVLDCRVDSKCCVVFDTDGSLSHNAFCTSRAGAEGVSECQQRAVDLSSTSVNTTYTFAFPVFSGFPSATNDWTGGCNRSSALIVSRSEPVVKITSAVRVSGVSSAAFQSRIKTNSLQECIDACVNFLSQCNVIEFSGPDPNLDTVYRAGLWRVSKEISDQSAQILPEDFFPMSFGVGTQVCPRTESRFIQSSSGKIFTNKGAFDQSCVTATELDTGAGKLKAQITSPSTVRGKLTVSRTSVKNDASLLFENDESPELSFTAGTNHVELTERYGGVVYDVLSRMDANDKLTYFFVTKNESPESVGGCYEMIVGEKPKLDN